MWWLSSVPPKFWISESTPLAARDVSLGLPWGNHYKCPFLFPPQDKKMWLTSIATAQICCEFLWVMSNSDWGSCRSHLVVVPSTHFARTYTLPTDNHQELWKCCCSSWHTDNFRCPWACAWLGQLWEQLMNKKESHTQACLLFFLLLIVTISFDLERQNTHGMLFGI